VLRNNTNTVPMKIAVINKSICDHVVRSKVVVYSEEQEECRPLSNGKRPSSSEKRIFDCRQSSRDKPAIADLLENNTKQ
jgi:hypothetical protein